MTSLKAVRWFYVSLAFCLFNVVLFPESAIYGFLFLICILLICILQAIIELL